MKIGELAEGIRKNFQIFHLNLGIIILFLLYEICWIAIFIIITIRFEVTWLFFSLILLLMSLLSLVGIIVFYKKIREIIKLKNKFEGGKKWQKTMS